MSLSHCRWNLLPPVPDKHLLIHSGFPPLIIQLLYNRGLREPRQLQSFLSSDESLSNNPLLLPDMHQAVARIYQALLSNENIAIYGDYDADGITATALLVQGLSALGGRAIPYIPHRLTEGYGLKKAALESLYQQGVSLVITVDCGITSLPEVKKARRMGLDIIITDHHTPLPEIPPAMAIVNPKLPNSTYPFSELTGAGVAFKLLQALFQSLGREEHLAKLMDLVALGTVADISPLLGENRYLVKEGLKLINATPRLGIKEIITQAGLNIGSLDAESISWVIAPRLNAAGRLEHAMTSYKLLMTDSPEEAYRLATWLEQKNTERQKLTATTLAKAREQVLAQGISPLLVASDNDYFIGIAGLVASRLSEEFYRPAIVIKSGEKICIGSCRSIPEFNIIAALNQYSHLLSQFGGHSQAAGFTLPTRNLARLQESLLQLATTQLAGVDLRPRLDIDAEVALPDLGGDTFQITQQLAPFGRGNPLPTFLSRRVEVIDCRTMGNDGEHLRLKLKQGGTRWDGVGFRLGNYLAEVASPLDIVYNLEIDRWHGEERLRLNILDFAPTKQTA
ncbi:MAG: single-stranded-DNA-specific exonuclease RecJ [Dehalococcoidia bacterium]|nr:MAG: single-stranded-DNA-specific exonuclease RecJ [Dehalococcoidia bacterium]